MEYLFSIFVNFSTDIMLSTTLFERLLHLLLNRSDSEQYQKHLELWTMDLLIGELFFLQETVQSRQALQIGMHALVSMQNKVQAVAKDAYR